MRKIIAVSFSVFFIILSTVSPTAAADDTQGRIREVIRSKVAALSGSTEGVCGQDTPCKPSLLTQFYTGRDFRPAWVLDAARHFQIKSLLNVIRDAPQEGLRPQDYKLDQLVKKTEDLNRLNQISDVDVDRFSDLDICLTDAFFRYGQHLYAGRIDYGALSPEWGAQRKEIDLNYILENALEYGDVGMVLRWFAPRQKAYADLKQALSRHREIAAAGGWPMIPKGTLFQKGKGGIPLVILRERLSASDDLMLPENEASPVFDSFLEEALRRFQKRHGLKDDGKIGPETLKYLNRPVEDVIRRIELNMDRLRWLPDDIGERYVLVNIADYSLELVDDEEPLLGMRIVIGKVENRSYILSDKISYLELNPYWNIPESIAQKETLPLIKKNPEYLNRKRIQVIKGWSNSPVVVPPDKINWSTVDVRKFRYRLRQEPGRGNPLGRVKFMFPNKYDVYLHDTSEKRLFARTKRNFSHGCIRIEKPIDLAVLLLESDPGWTEKKLIQEIKKEKNMALKLPEAVPIHIVYWTAWVDRDGALQIRDDVYGMDKFWDNSGYKLQ